MMQYTVWRCRSIGCGVFGSRFMTILIKRWRVFRDVKCLKTAYYWRHTTTRLPPPCSDEINVSSHYNLTYFVAYPARVIINTGRNTRVRTTRTSGVLYVYFLKPKRKIFANEVFANRSCFHRCTHITRSYRINDNSWESDTCSYNNVKTVDIGQCRCCVGYDFN